MSKRAPLQGVRVIDFGQLTAGANTSAMLADLGADVIKIESPASMDLFRTIGAVDREPGWWNRSAPFQFSNRNKRSIALDLKQPEGLSLVRELITQADIVVENFRRGVLERLGLDFPKLKALQPRIILASISSQGETGPNRLHASFGSTLDASGGLSDLTGYPDADPLVSGSDVNYPDQVVSLISAGFVLAALREVRRTGQGMLLDISQREVVSFLVGEEIVAAGADPAYRSRRAGNQQDGLLLQDCFRSADGRWVAVTVADLAQSQTILQGLGQLQNLAQLQGLGQGDDLRLALESACAGLPAEQAARWLTDLGIAAAPVLDGMDLLDAPGLSGHTLATDAKGRLVKGMPYGLAGHPLVVDRQAPDLGEHTDEILREVLGLGEHDLHRLRSLGVTRVDPG